MSGRASPRKRTALSHVQANMISFDLRCSSDHVFEGWFGSSADFEDQSARGLVTCPVCGNGEVRKALMAPNVASRKGGDEAGVDPRQMYVMLKKLRREVEKNADYVGPRFAEEARRIHYGESDPRGIYGESTAEEAEALREEGVEFTRIPWVPDAEN